MSLVKSLALLLIFCITWQLGRTQELEEPIRIKVLSLNILHGATTKNDFNLDAIANVIIKADPDLVALQEVDFKTNRAKEYDLATELGFRCKMVSVFGRAMFYDDGEYGEAILSKTTFIGSSNVPLPYSPGNEPRTALEIVTVLPSGDTISFVGTHLDHLREDVDRFSQVIEINRRFKHNVYPSILAGDFNAVPDSRVIAELEREWIASYNKDDPKPTFPSDNPNVKIDYVMFKPEGKWNVVDRIVLQDSIASDHCGYLVILELIPD